MHWSQKNEDSHFEYTQSLRDQALGRILWGKILLVAAAVFVAVPFTVERGTWAAGVLAFIQFGFISIGWRLIYFNRVTLFDLRDRFCSRKLIPESRRFRRLNPRVHIWIPKMKIFCKTNDLRELEQRFLDYLHREFRLFQHEDQLHKWVPINNRLWEDLEVDLRTRFYLKEETIDEIFAKWKTSPPQPARRKQFVQKLTAALEHKQFTLRLQRPKVNSDSAGEKVAPAAPFDPIVFYELEASNAVKPEAIALYKRGLNEPERRKKIRLFKQATWIERQSEKQEPVPLQADVNQFSATPREVEVLDLSGLIEEQLSKFIRPGIDPRMAVEILMVLASPRRRFRIWGDETVLVRRIRRRYEITTGKPFELSTLRNTLNWLSGIGVVISEPAKSNTVVYHIPRNSSSARTDEAKELIRTVSKLRELLISGKY